MEDLLGALFLVWIIGVSVTILFAMGYEDWKITLVSPIWPVFIVVFWIKSVRNFWINLDNPEIIK